MIELLQPSQTFRIGRSNLEDQLANEGLNLAGHSGQVAQFTARAVQHPGYGNRRWPTHMKKFVFDRTRINEVVGIFADCEGSEPEGERTSQSAAQKMEAHNDDGTEGHQGEGRPVGTCQAARQRFPGLQDHGIQPG
jgi:hypothetical protein